MSRALKWGLSVLDGAVILSTNMKFIRSEFIEPSAAIFDDGYRATRSAERGAVSGLCGPTRPRALATWTNAREAGRANHRAPLLCHTSSKLSYEQVGSDGQLATWRPE